MIKERANYYIFEGEKLVRDILKRDLEIEKLIVNDRREGQLNLTGKAIKEIWYVPDPVLKKISALKEKADFIAVLKLKPMEIDFTSSKIIMAVDSIQDPGNAGTIFRCAAAFGIDAVALCAASVSPNNPRFLRAAQTSLFDIDFQQFADVESLLKKAQAENFNIYMTSANPLPNTLALNKLSLPCLVVLGSEGHGLKQELFSRYPGIHIPQSPRVESLNLGVSACIIMHELRKLF